MDITFWQPSDRFWRPEIRLATDFCDVAQTLYKYWFGHKFDLLGRLPRDQNVNISKDVCKKSPPPSGAYFLMDFNFCDTSNEILLFLSNKWHQMASDDLRWPQVSPDSFRLPQMCVWFWSVHETPQGFEGSVRLPRGSVEGLGMEQLELGSSPYVALHPPKETALPDAGWAGLGWAQKSNIS